MVAKQHNRCPTQSHVSHTLYLYNILELSLPPSLCGYIYFEYLFRSTGERIGPCTSFINSRMSYTPPSPLSLSHTHTRTTLTTHSHTCSSSDSGMKDRGTSISGRMMGERGGIPTGASRSSLYNCSNSSRP